MLTSLALRRCLSCLTCLSLACFPFLPALARPAPEADGPAPAGVITLAVDLSDVMHKRYHVVERVPVVPGALTLMFPKWIQGNHAPWSDAVNLAGLRIRGGGAPLAWHRDTEEMFAFHLEVPQGTQELEVQFDYLAPNGPRNWDGLLVSRNMLDLEWNAAILYPARVDYRRQRVRAGVVLPDHWAFACSLDGARVEGAQVGFAETTLETLLDSPLYAGPYRTVLDLAPGDAVPVHLDVFAEAPEYLQVPERALHDYRQLVREAYALFGARHYDHYDFLLSVSDTFGGKGLEHHRSTETGLPLAAFTDYEHQWSDRSLLPHEFTHSWNGKFRRPFDTWSPDPALPLRNSLLWVYEGQTEYWGRVLAARSGLFSANQSHEDWAAMIAEQDGLAGRSWRSLQDTTLDEILAVRGAREWPTYQRNVDYYAEGALIWLDADTLIRERSRGQRSLDDFARRFFGQDDGAMAPQVYDFDEVVGALQAVQPYDWAGFLRSRLDAVGAPAPLDGLRRAGWKLVFDDQPNEAIAAQDSEHHTTSLQYSLGLQLNKDDEVAEVVWDSPAFRAGLAPDMKLVAVNGLKFSVERLKEAIDAAARQPDQPVVLDLLDDEHLERITIDYHGGNRYPHLQRIEGSEDLLGPILAPRAAG